MDKKQRKNKNSNKVNANTPQQQQLQEQQRRPTISHQKRGELRKLITRLLELGFKQAINQDEEWQHYTEIQGILQRIMQIEAPLRLTPHHNLEARLAKLPAFYRWAEENGATYNGVTVSSFPGYDFGFEATRDIAKEELLFTIPRKMILSEETLTDDFNEALLGSMTNLKLAYALMLEKLAPDSFWKPYIDIFPEKYSTVLYFSVKEMEQLRGSQAFTPALRQCKAIARQYAFIYNYSQSLGRGGRVSVQGQRLQEFFTYDLYRWSVSTVMTRENLIPRIIHRSTTNGDGGEQTRTEMIAALIPLWDIANHKHGIVSSYFNMATNQMESEAMEDYKKGSQVFIYYGDRPNADLLVHNGFVYADHQNDSVSIKLGLNPTDSLFQKRAALLAVLDIPNNGELKVFSPPKFISPELLAFVRVFNMNEEQLTHWSYPDHAADLMHVDCALETALEAKTWQYLQIRFMLLLRNFPTTLEDDEAHLAEYRKGVQQISQHSAMLLEFRILEKRILTAAWDYCKQRLKA